MRPPRAPLALLAVGVSTGGPEALRALLSGLAADFPLPMVIVQHMPGDFVPSLVRRLDGACALEVAVARDGEALKAGMVRIAPGGTHLAVASPGVGLVTRLERAAPEHGCRPAVDALFRSAARACGPQTLALVLTGMGRDGFAGAQELAAVGAEVVVQDEASSVVWGMPGLVARAGLADAVVPLDRLGVEVRRRVLARLPPDGGRRRGPGRGSDRSRAA